MKPWVLALIGFCISTAGAGVDLSMLNHSTFRNGYWSAIPLTLGALFCAAAIVKQRSWSTILPAIVPVVALGLYVWGWTLTVPPSAPLVGSKESFPDATLPDSNGAMVRLSDLWKEKPLVLVLFRGHW